MPTITVEGPKVTDLDKKRAFVSVATEAASKLYDVPRQAIIVLSKENSPDNVALGGQLIVDRPQPKKGTQ